MREVDSIAVAEPTEVPFDIADLSDVALSSLLQVLASSDITYALEGNVLRVDNSVASEAGRLVHTYSTVPSETDGAVGDQALNEHGDNEELHTTLEGRIRRLIQMHEDGLITESELSERRREILREV